MTIPGRQVFQIHHLVLDVNGTLALDGKIIDGIIETISSLKEHLEIHLITADTHKQQGIIDQILNLKAERLIPGEDEPGQKAAFVRQLGSSGVVAIGQGANDAGMLEEAGIGIAVQSPEGLAVSALLAADLVVPDIFCAFELLEKPLRIVATLRT